MSMNISAFRDLAYNTSLRDNVSIVLNNQGNGLETVRSRGLFALFNKNKLTNNSAFQMLGNALRADFSSKANLTDAQCTTTLNRAFTAAFGENFDLARAAGQKLTPSMLRKVLSSAQEELRLMKVTVGRAFIERMGQPLPSGGLASARPNFGKAQPVVEQTVSLLERHAFSTVEATSMEQSLTKLRGSLECSSDPRLKTYVKRIDDKIQDLRKLKDSERLFADDLKANHSISQVNVDKFVGEWHQVTLSVLREIGIPQDKLNTLTPDMIVENKPVYTDGICTNIMDVLPCGTDKISKFIGEAVKKWAEDNLTKAELKTFKDATSSKVRGSVSLSKRLKAERTSQTEKKDHWQNISKEFKTLTAGGPVMLKSTMTSGVNLGGQIYGDAKTGGHTSGDKSTTDAVNVWQTKLTTGDGKLLFNAVRHGVCVADKLKGEARTNAAISRAEGVAKATFLARPDLQALVASGRGMTAEDAIEFNITNISLLSTVNERSLVSGQKAAFNAINGRNEPIELKLTDGTSVFIKPKFTMFNFSVNIWNPISGLSQTNLNRAAFNQFSARVEDYLKTHMDDSNRGVIQQLLSEVKKIVDETGYQRGVNDLYKASGRIAVLSNLIGEVPTFNCKSGKDRTGQNDVEAKFLATLIENKMPIPELDAPLTPEQTRIYRDIALQSGNLEIQKLNTGLGGFKTANRSANITRMGGDDDAFMKSVFVGGSDAVSS